jgi:nucleotide-binding universal stress UspA family protein
VDLTLVVAAQDAKAHERLLAEARDVLGRPPSRHLVVTGSLSIALLETAQTERPDLVVYGERGRLWGRWAQLRRRDPLYALLPVSSLLVRPAVRPIARVLICAGGDDSILEDARFTGRLVRSVQAQATILHVLSQVPLIFGAGSQRERITESFAATGAPEMQFMQQAAEELEHIGVRTDIKVRVGLVVEEIAAELVEGGYDLLVIGAHRSEGMVQRFLLEDVAANILGKKLGPVLVVKQPAG